MTEAYFPVSGLPLNAVFLVNRAFAPPGLWLQRVFFILSPLTEGTKVTRVGIL